MSIASGSRVRLGVATLVTVLSVPVTVALSPMPAMAAATCRVTNTTTHAAGNDLHAALAAAAAGQTLVITGTCIGDYVVTKPVTLKKGATAATLKGFGSRTLKVTASPGGVVKLIGLKITGGVAFDCPAYSGYACGAGLYNLGKVSLSHVTVTGNKASSNGLGGDGGGIFNALGAVMAIDASTISGNTANGPATSLGAYAGGISNEGTMTISRSKITGNVADAGASGPSEGGGIYNYGGTLTITSTTISGDRASHDAVPHGSALQSSYGGGISDEAGGTLTITNSTISGNVARASATAEGGGLLDFSGSAGLTNVTLSGNQAVLTGTVAGGTVQGGGISQLGTSDLRLTAVTVTLNTVSDQTGAASQKSGGGIQSAGAPRTKSSIIAGNTAPTASDCSLGVSTGSAGHNLIGDDTGCGASFVDGVNGDKVGLAAHLGPLASNGGPTKTHALLAGSPAIDMAGGSPCATAKDQRGVARPKGPRCDAGAYEKT